MEIATQTATDTVVITVLVGTSFQSRYERETRAVIAGAGKDHGFAAFICCP